MLDDSWLIDIVDSEWRNDKLPSEDIQVPIENTIDPENSENEGNSAKDQVSSLDSKHLICLVIDFVSVLTRKTNGSIWQS